MSTTGKYDPSNAELPVNMNGAPATYRNQSDRLKQNASEGD